MTATTDKEAFVEFLLDDFPIRPSPTHRNVEVFLGGVGVMEIKGGKALVVTTTLAFATFVINTLLFESVMSLFVLLA